MWIYLGYAGCGCAIIDLCPWMVPVVAMDEYVMGGPLPAVRLGRHDHMVACIFISGGMTTG